jgi:hypothetical protein
MNGFHVRFTPAPCAKYLQDHVALWIFIKCYLRTRIMIFPLVFSARSVEEIRKRTLAHE